MLTSIYGNLTNMVLKTCHNLGEHYKTVESFITDFDKVWRVLESCKLIKERYLENRIDKQPNNNISNINIVHSHA